MGILILVVTSLILVSFIFSKPGYIAAYLLLFQDFLFIKFYSVGIPEYRHYYYALIFIIYFIVNKKELVKDKVYFTIKDPLFLSIIIIIVGMLVHDLIIGIDSGWGREIVNRYYSQVLPLILLAGFFLTKKKTITQFGEGIILFGILYFLTVAFTINIDTLWSGRQIIREQVIISPIGITRTFSMVFVVAFIYLYRNEWLSANNKIYYYLAVATSLSMIVATGSRGPILATLLALTLYTFTSTKKSKIKVLFKYLSTFAVIVPLIYMFSEMYNLEIFDRFAGLQNYDDMRRFDRYLLVIFLLDNINFIVGLGPGGYNMLTLGESHYVHNILIELIIEYGLFGVLSITLIIIYSNIYGYKFLKRFNLNYTLHYIYLLWLLFFVSSLVSGYISSNREFWVFTIMLVYLNYFYSKEKSYRLSKQKYG